MNGRPSRAGSRAVQNGKSVFAVAGAARSAAGTARGVSVLGTGASGRRLYDLHDFRRLAGEKPGVLLGGPRWPRGRELHIGPPSLLLARA